MSTLLDKLKSKLGLKSKNEPSKSPSTSAQISNECLDVTYNETTLGITVQPNLQGQPHVTAIASNSISQRCGVDVGDTIISVDGNRVLHYDDFMSIFPALPRPLTIRLSTTYLFTYIHSLRFQKYSSAQPEYLNDDAKEARRLNMIKAAQEREKAWDKKVASAAVNRKKKVIK